MLKSGPSSTLLAGTIISLHFGHLLGIFRRLLDAITYKPARLIPAERLVARLAESMFEDRVGLLEERKRASFNRFVKCGDITQATQTELEFSRPYWDAVNLHGDPEIDQPIDGRSEDLRISLVGFPDAGGVLGLPVCQMDDETT